MFWPGRVILSTMMQVSDSYSQKNSLFNAMNRFIGAVNNMDQTVMVPSLLRDVPLDQGPEPKLPETGTGTCSNGRARFQQDWDMYSSYVLLKSIRNDMEWGVLQGDEPLKHQDPEWPSGTGRVDLKQVEDDDLEKQFHFHLSGLHVVLSKLTHRANTLTKRYTEEVGCRS